MGSYPASQHRNAANNRTAAVRQSGSTFEPAPWDVSSGICHVRKYSRRWFPLWALGDGNLEKSRLRSGVGEMEERDKTVEAACEPPFA